MHPVFSLGGLEVHAYALFTWLGALTACALALPGLRRAGMTTARSAAALGSMCLCFLVGARLWNAAVNPGSYLGAFKWYTLRLAGLSLYGGAAGAALALWLWARVSRVPVLAALDAVTAPGAAAFCLARVGCFLNGCCGGKATDGPLGVLFPAKTALPGVLSFLQNRPVHPTQLYELAGAAAALAAVWLLCRRFDAAPGSRFLLYAALFSLVRLIVLPYRALSYPEAVTRIVYPALYLAVIAGALILAARINRRPGAAGGRAGQE